LTDNAEELERFTTRLPREMRRDLKIAAAREGRPVQAVVTQVLQEWLDKITNR